MKWKNCLLLTAIILLLFSCDPARRIQMKNKSNEDAFVIWTLKEDSARFSPFFISNSTEVKIDLKRKAPDNTVNMSFGMGTWDDAIFMDLIDDLVSLEIKKATDSFKLSAQQEIKQYLAAKRKGYGNSIIRLVIEK